MKKVARSQEPGASRAAPLAGLAVEMWPIARPQPYAKNARTVTARAIDSVAASLKEFGWRQPIVVDTKDVIVAGHKRLLAAQKLGMTEVPVHVAAGLTDAQCKAYRLMDNRSNQNSEWELELVQAELVELQGDIDLQLTGFEQAEIATFLEAAKVTPPGAVEAEDELPEVPDTAVTAPGDVWALGGHRLMCGDSTNAEAVARVMDGKEADICFTSPPYGQQRDYGGKIADWTRLMRAVYGILPVKPAAQILVNLGLIHRQNQWCSYWDAWIHFMRDSGWRAFGWYVWDQGPGIPGDYHGRLAQSHEFVFHFNRVSSQARKTKQCKWAGTMNHGSGQREADGVVAEYTHAGRDVQAMKIPDSVIRVMRHKARGIECEHPAVFPVALAEEILTAFSDEGNIAFEPFTGSGSQMIAAEKTKRSCFGLELEPKYVDVAVTRWQTFTGQPAKLDGDGRTFDEIKAERAAPVKKTRKAA